MSKQLPPFDEEVLFFLPEYNAAYRGQLLDLFDDEKGRKVTTLELNFSVPMGSKDIVVYHDQPEKIALCWTFIPYYPSEKELAETDRFKIMDI